MDGSFSGLAIGVTIFGAAVAGAITSIVELGTEGSKIQGVTEAFDTLAIKAGTTGDVLRDNLLTGVKHTIDDMAVMQDTAKLLGSGMKLTGDQALLMGQAARELGKATGTDASSGLEMMSSALVTGRTRSLQMQIGLIDVAAGEEKFAASIGVTRAELNAAGLLEGKRIAIFDATQSYLERLGISELSFAEKIAKGEVAIEDWVDGLRLSVGTSKDVNEALDTVAAAISRAFGAESQTMADAIVSGINAFSRGVTAVVPYIETFASAVKTVLSAAVQWAPLFETIAAGVVTWYVALGVATVAMGLAGLAATAYGATMTLLTGEMVATTAAVEGVTFSVHTLASAVASFAAGYALGTWLEKNTAWARDMSDSFEWLALRIQGVSDADAHAIIANEHAAESEAKRTKGLTDLQKAMEQVGSVEGVSIDAYVASSKAIGDNSEFLKDNKSAVEALVAALEGESKKTKDVEMAVSQVIKTNTQDYDTKVRVVDAIDKLIRAHQALTPELQKYRDENEAIGTQEIKFADTMVALREKTLLSEMEYYARDSELQQAKLDHSEQVEVQSFQKQAERRLINEEQLAQAVEEIHKHYAAQKLTDAKLLEEAQWVEIEKVTAEGEKIVRSLSLNTEQAKRDDAYATTVARIDAMQRSKTYTVQAEMEIWAAFDATNQKITQGIALQDKTTRTYYESIAVIAKQHYADALADSENYTTERLDQLQREADAAALALDLWGQHAEAKLKDVATTAGVTTAALHAMQSAMTFTLQSKYSLDPNDRNSWDAKIASFGPTARLAFDSYNNPYVYIPGVNAAPPPREGGGPVAANQPYMVGERGPELFVPQSSGMIQPNVGRGDTINVYVTNPLGTPEVIAKVVGEALANRDRRIGVRQPTGV